MISTVILSSRESPDILERSVIRTMSAMSSLGGIVDIVINGNKTLADTMKLRLDTQAPHMQPTVRVRLWFLPLGDKAHAWNVYVHEIWPIARTTVFIDGYVEPDTQSIIAIDRALTANKEALAATGIPSVGLSANKLRREMIKDGGIHGNLYGMSRLAMETLRQMNFRLPLGLYRTDPMLGAVLCYQFRPDKYEWDIKKIMVLPEVTWSFKNLKWWRAGDVLSHFKRMMRQGQGALENKAYRYFFNDRKLRPENLPSTVIELIEMWLLENPKELAEIIRPFSTTKHALAVMRKPRDWSLSRKKQVQLFDSVHA